MDWVDRNLVAPEEPLPTCIDNPDLDGLGVSFVHHLKQLHMFPGMRNSAQWYGPFQKVQGSVPGVSIQEVEGEGKTMD